VARLPAARLAATSRGRFALPSRPSPLCETTDLDLTRCSQRPQRCQRCLRDRCVHGVRQFEVRIQTPGSASPATPAHPLANGSTVVGVAGLGLAASLAREQSLELPHAKVAKSAAKESTTYRARDGGHRDKMRLESDQIGGVDRDNVCHDVGTTPKPGSYSTKR
jgi:hypothetical protein